MLKKYLNKDGKVKYRIKQLVKNSTKAQSAMEYLMTYGWSILIIAIVLVSLFELGIFGSSSLSGNGSCIAQTQFLCTKPILASNGILMATIGETLGQITLTGTACLNNTAQPSSSSFNSVSPPVIINNGETFQIGFYCPITSNAIGTSFNGNLWMQYNTPAASGQIIKIGSVSLKVTLSATSSSGGSGGSPVYYTPITLSNQQSSATASGFQQMIYFNPSTYSSNEMANLSNIEFTAGAPIGTSGNVPLYAWIESGASSTATNTVAWVNLASNTLGAAGSGTNTLTIYMNFLPNNSPVTSGYTGYAPQLYCASGCFQTSYAQYDDGSNVFLLYFNGDTPLSDFNFEGNTGSQASITGPTGTTINVLSLTGYSSNFGMLYTSKSLSNQPIIAESSSQQNGKGTGGTGADNGQVSIVSGTSTSGLDAISVDMGYGGSYFSNNYFSGGSQTVNQNPQGTANTNWNYASVIYTGSSATSWSGYIAPQLYFTTGGYSGSISNNVLSSASTLYLGLIGDVTSGDFWQTYINWMRARAYPPNGVMPSASFGSIT